MGLISRVSSRTYRKLKNPQIKMARGNQRDLARAKNQKKQADKEKGRKDDGLSKGQREELDAEIMRQKQEKKNKIEAEKAANAKATNTGKKEVIKTKGKVGY